MIDEKIKGLDAIEDFYNLIIDEINTLKAKVEKLEKLGGSQITL